MKLPENSTKDKREGKQENELRDMQASKMSTFSQKCQKRRARKGKRQYLRKKMKSFSKACDKTTHRFQNTMDPKQDFKKNTCTQSTQPGNTQH